MYISFRRTVGVEYPPVAVTVSANKYCAYAVHWKEAVLL